MAANSYKKIMIFGIPGSGKSTFAMQLSRVLHLPVFHLDKYFYVNSWQERHYEEFLSIQKELVSKERWIIDGNATRSLELRFSRADLVLYFRYNRLLCLYRIFKRLLHKDPHISDRAEGCKEKVHFKLIRYTLGFPKRVEHTIKQLRAHYPHVPCYELHSDEETQAFLKNLCTPGP